MTEWKKDKVYQQLRRLPKSQLMEIAGEFNPPVEVGKTSNRNMIAAAIRRRQIEANNHSVQGEQPNDLDVKDNNAEFEAALQNETAEPKKDGRGGARPGAGRPLGQTDDLA